MSVEQAKAFIEKLDSDKSFLTQVAGAASDEGRLELARAAGFQFTTENLADATGESDGEELSDDDSEAVAGGVSLSSGSDTIKKFGERWGPEEFGILGKNRA